MPVRKIITLERSRILDEYVGDVHGLTIFIDAYVPERAGNVHPKLAYEDFDYRGNPILRQYKYHYET